MDLNINTGCFGMMFGVPNDVVDHYLRLASDNNLKVLLFYLRYNNKKINTSSAAAFLNIPESEVVASIEFWNNTNIFCTNKIQNEENNIQNESLKKVTPVIKQDNKKYDTQKRDTLISPSAISKMIDNSKELKSLFNMTEFIFKRNLSYSEQQVIIYILNELKIESAAIVTLIKYCETINKLNMQYILKIAEKWHESGVTTLEAADREIQKETEKKNFYGKIYKAFNLKNPLTTTQRKYADLWKEKNYNFELIVFAYEKAIEKINQANFKYINTTLENWDKSGFRTISDIKKGSPSPPDSGVDYNELVNNFGGIYG